jgi:hypothetical protein
MLVYFVSDEPAKIPTVRAMLEPQNRVALELSESGDTHINPNRLLVVDADLRRLCVEPNSIVLQELWY